jgi:hypothetical protein
VNHLEAPQAVVSRAAELVETGPQHPTARQPRARRDPEPFHTTCPASGPFLSQIRRSQVGNQVMVSSNRPEHSRHPPGRAAPAVTAASP